MIVTLYKDTFYDGIGQVVEVKPGDCLIRRILEDSSFVLIRAADAQATQRISSVTGLHSARSVDAGHEVSE